MLKAYLNKRLAISASVLSAVSLMVAMPHTVRAQMMDAGTGMQTGVDGSQANPGSSSGSGQIVAPSNTVEGAGMEADTNMNSTEMNSTEMQTGGRMQIGVDGSQANPGSSSGSGQIVAPSNTVEGSGMEADMNSDMGTTVPTSAPATTAPTSTSPRALW